MQSWARQYFRFATATRGQHNKAFVTSDKTTNFSLQELRQPVSHQCDNFILATSNSRQPFLAEVGTRENFCDNTTMSQSRKIVAVATGYFLKIVALSWRKIVANFRDIRLTNGVWWWWVVGGGWGVWVAGDGWQVAGGRWGVAGSWWQVVVDGGSRNLPPRMRCAVFAMTRSPLTTC